MESRVVGIMNKVVTSESRVIAKNSVQVIDLIVED